MSKIDRIYVAAHKADLRLTRICVASIRRWYPALPVYLLKDLVHGDFSTAELESKWNVRIWPTSDRIFGWGFVKLEPLFATESCRYLVLDSDIVLLGHVIETLEKSDADFVVQLETQASEDIPSLYFDQAILKSSLNPSFPGISFTFNTGQYVATSGKLSREDFAAVINWTQPRSVKHPSVFNPSDQGILNYVLLSKFAKGEITVDREPFMRWGENETREFDVKALHEKSPYPLLIHWAGLKKTRMRQMMRSDILMHFEQSYYSRIRYGTLTRCLRLVRAEIERWERRVSRKLGRLHS